MVAPNQRRMRIFSRFSLETMRTRAQLISGARVFAMLAILVGAQAVTRLEPSASAETKLVVPLAAPMPALHSVVVSRVAFSSRAPSRLPDDIGVALAADGFDGVATALASHALPAVAIERPSGSVVARGYDATAPPALS
jgi:hypothetical protein